MSVIVRKTFIEIERPADPNSARRASSLPHEWRFRDYSDSSIGAGTRLAITNADDESEAMQINSQSAANSSMSAIPPVIPTQLAYETQKPQVHPIAASPLEMERDNCAVRLNALDLFLPPTRTSGCARIPATQVPPKGLIICARPSNVKTRSMSTSSNRSGCSGNSLDTGSTRSCSEMGSGVSCGSSLSVGVDTPINAARFDGGSSLPSPSKTAPMPEEADHVSGSRRSRRRRAAARRAAEQGQLRVHAPLFQPLVAAITPQASTFSNEMFDMVSVAQASILSCPHVLSVQIVKPVSHQKATSIVVSFHPGKVWAHDVHTLAKNAFLEAAEKSEQVFILGYGVDPFSDQSDEGFTATIGCVPVDRQHAICWDFWQKGFCQRLSICRWCHPVSSDLMDVKFVFEPAQLPLQPVHSFWNGPGCQVDSWRATANCWMGA